MSRFLLCKHVVQLFHPVEPQFFLEVIRNQSLPFWSHPSLKPLANAKDIPEEGQPAVMVGEGDNDGNGNGNAYLCVNAAGYEFGDSNLKSDDDDNLVDTEGRSGPMDKATVKEKLENYI